MALAILLLIPSLIMLSMDVALSLQPHSGLTFSLSCLSLISPPGLSLQTSCLYISSKNFYSPKLHHFLPVFWDSPLPFLCPFPDLERWGVAEKSHLLCSCNGSCSSVHMKLFEHIRLSKGSQLEPSVFPLSTALASLKASAVSQEEQPVTRNAAPFILLKV